MDMLSTAWVAIKISHIFSKNHFEGGNAGVVGGGEGTYFSNPGEVVIWSRCPRQFPYYIMDDDKVREKIKNQYLNS